MKVADCRKFNVKHEIVLLYVNEYRLGIVDGSNCWVFVEVSRATGWEFIYMCRIVWNVSSVYTVGVLPLYILDIYAGIYTVTTPALNIGIIFNK